ncbi:MAG: DUF2285 domain-containing protein [Alphaproteobacteria bacterium]|nr:DUF2285 domain-containing protein [Alphaproteobacteria bacterium]
MAGKSQRQIAIDLFGAEVVEAEWHADSWIRSRVRWNIRKALQLMEGGYRDLLGDGRHRHGGHRST